MSITTGTNKTTYSRHLHRQGTEQNDYAVILPTDRNESRPIYMHQMSLTANIIAAKLTRHYARTGTKTVADNNSSFDSDGDHPLSLSKVSHHNRLRSFSGLPPPERSDYTKTLYPLVQTIYCKIRMVFISRST